LSFEIVVLCDAIRFMRHRVGAHKVRQITIISYSPVIQNKLYVRQRNGHIIQQFQLSKINKAKQHVLKKNRIYREPGPSSKAESTDGLN